MSVRTRFGIAAVLLAAITVAAFGAVAFALFVRQQDLQLENVLVQDLQRVSALLSEPRLGATLTDTSSTGTILQLVTPDGHVAVAWGSDELLPAVPEPERLEIGGRTHLAVASATGTGGSVRLAHDVTAAHAIRDRLLRSLVLGGVVVALGAGALGFVSSGRLLAPLRRVAARARELDPANPQTIEVAYAGPDDEVSDLVRALNTALASIRAQKDEERMFLTEIAHELATPLTLVSYHLDAAVEDREAASLQAAAAAAKELLRTSQDLLVLARGEIERPLELHIVAIADIVRRLANEYRGLKTDVRSEGTVVGDPERLMQAVRNVVRNAVQATGDPTGVTVAVYAAGNGCILTVRDEGPGMSREVAVRVFDRLYSGTQGVGVGLSIARSIVEQHAGTIEVLSELGEGTTFRVWLPAVPAEADAGTHASGSSTESSSLM